MQVQGHVEPGFEPVREVFEKQFTEGLNVGGSVAVNLRGKPVVNLWGGTTAPDGGEPWREETMTIVYSTTKGLTATCLHVLADRGRVHYDDLVSKYWPEFARNGKDKITVRHLLTHQAGIPQMPEGLRTGDLLDWHTMVRALEELSPVWEPGTDTGYHALDFGWLVGEIVRRIDGRSLGTFLHEEICKPLGIKKLFVGAPESEEPSIAPLHSPARTPEQEAMAKAWMEGNTLITRAMGIAIDPDDTGASLHDVLNTRLGHAAELPAVSGVACARDLARFYACLANYGELDGVRILSEATVRRMSEEQSHRPDRVIIGIPIRWSLGYMNGGDPMWPQGPRKTSFGHPGAGGSVGFADPEIGMSFGYVPNMMAIAELTGIGRASALADAARACIA
jgi:CubicO group peptidase (beta-lactamase class C family)